MTQGDDQTTLQHEGEAREPAGLRVPALTILSHPDLDRIGEISLLTDFVEGRSVSLSRLSPDFGQPGDPWHTRPISDPYLSRTPHYLVLDAASGLEVRPRQGSDCGLRVRGEEVSEPFTATAQELDDGLIVELEDRVALWLHRLPADAMVRPRLPDLGMVGSSRSLDEAREAILRIAAVDLPVLLRGESGTGKELAARALHAKSPRAGEPFLAVNLGAMAPGLAAAELFGNVRGAFTGADVAREGYFRAAQGGTLFLDEVGEAPPEVQVMLLRALETGEIMPVGSHTPRPVDVRLIAATDSDLESRARRGEFKEPLIHRLAAYEIRLPALRDRFDDLGRLTLHFARSAVETLGRTQPPSDAAGPPWLPSELMRGLIEATWPGNVRQLRNVVRKLVIDQQEARSLSPDFGIRTDVREEKVPPGNAYPRPAAIGDRDLEQAFRHCNFEPAATARRLGISRASMYNLVRRHPDLRMAEDVGGDELEAALAAANGDVHVAARRLEVSGRALARRVGRRAGSDAS